jgi:hypothetical protein
MKRKTAANRADRPASRNIQGERFGQALRPHLGQTASGNTEMCEVRIFGEKGSLMCTKNEHPSFNDVVAFTI